MDEPAIDESTPTQSPSHDPTRPPSDDAAPTLDDFGAGFLVGILVGEGHFGGDGRQPQVTLRMHTDHEALFRWLVARVPGSRLYGPYHHAGRSYFQWMARGECLRERLVPMLEARLTPELDERAWRRFRQMRADYRIDARRTRRALAGPSDILDDRPRDPARAGRCLAYG